MFLFLFLLISCLAVSASLVAEETKEGVAVFVAEITSWCGIGSGGVAALLSACLLVRCFSHQFVFPCLQMLFRGTPPLCVASCNDLPGHNPSYISRRHLIIAGEGGRWFSSSMPARRRGWLLGCGRLPYTADMTQPSH